MAGLRLRESSASNEEQVTCTGLTSIVLNTLPFHSCCHSLALFPCLNFINTVYRFALDVRTILKWLTSLLVLSPTQDRKSDGVM